MGKSLKIAISLPEEDFKKIEEVRKKLDIDRSSVIDRAIRFWLKHLEKEKLIKQYIEGYKRVPETARESKAMERVAAEAFKEESLK